MRRHLFGIIAIALVGGAVALWVRKPALGNPETWDTLRAAFSRVGTLCGVIWLAYRELERLPAWLFAAIPVAGLIIAARPKWAIIIVPLALALMFLGPRKKSQGSVSVSRRRG